MALQTIYLQHIPVDMPIHLALYRDVRNTAFLKQQLLSGNQEFEYAFIDATMIISTSHALAAVYRALNDHLQGRRRSRNVHAEIVFSLSPNNNVRLCASLDAYLTMPKNLGGIIRLTAEQITESFKRFGIDDSTTSVLVIKVSTTPTITHESVQQHLDSVIEGTAVQFSNENIRAMTDFAKVRKVYKLNDSSGKKRGKAGDQLGTDGAEQNMTEIESAILGAIALRGAT
ncbi:MAG: hypothetical protein M1816_000887 [Peltula sp. TS41687]|nr:MAG: hypothetical protein M1816_000887 [Peltula sp. TS41687]